MKSDTLTRYGRYLGIAAAVTVPALVIAQQQPAIPADGTFVPDSLLRAGDIEALRDGLAFALQRLNQLESNQAGNLVKENLYEIETESTPVPANAVAIATAACRDTNDVLINCGCRGLQDANNSLQFDLRRVSPVPNLNSGTAGCVCQAQNVGDNSGDRILVATGTCLTVP